LLPELLEMQLLAQFGQRLFVLRQLLAEQSWQPPFELRQLDLLERQRPELLERRQLEHLLLEMLLQLLDVYNHLA
jgi:hypothetical protein